MRFPTREVFVGKVAIGKNNPIRIQSMTNVSTLDVEKTVSQIIALHENGCEIARVAVQNQKEALSLEKIKNSLLSKNIDIPLVADIHFFPPAAIVAAEFVEKVRINPGNYLSDRFSGKDYLRHLEEKLVLLIEKCRKHKTAIRLGVNHGSISKRIQELYLSDEDRMVESVIEYAKIFKKHDFNELIFSLKASNAMKMIDANRWLIKRMKEEGLNHPIHLGVTEAGDVEDGIIKSACGIGLLLLEGIGDTIRVSLTDDPILEIEPAKKIINSCNEVQKESMGRDLSQYKASHTSLALYSGIERESDLNSFSLKSSGVFVEHLELADLIRKKYDRDVFLIKKEKNSFSAKNLKHNHDFSLSFDNEKKDFVFFKYQPGFLDSFLKALGDNNFSDFFLSFTNQDRIDSIKAAVEIAYLFSKKLLSKIIVWDNPKAFSFVLTLMQAFNQENLSVEIVSCPGCGRTQYDHKQIAAKVKEKTRHLQNIKIAVMGCVVNGLGEIKEADFGCIGFGKGKANIYVGDFCVAKDIDENLVADKILECIKKSTKWQEPVGIEGR